MINLYPKTNMRKSAGAVTLIISIVLMVTTTLIIIFAADQGRIQEKMLSNLARNKQAFYAAEAGMEYGINYFKQNSVAILASPVSGYLQAYSNSNTTNVVLADNSKYSFTYTNPIANNYTLIQITSTGTSSDGSAVRVISQKIQLGSMLATPPTTAVVTKGSLSLGGSSQITNTTNNQTVQSASTVSISGSAQTVTSSGSSSYAGHIAGDISQNNTTLQNLSQSDFFSSYFGQPSTTMKNNAVNYYSSSSDTNYSSTLNGMTGTSIWIDQTSGTTTLNGSTTIGSASQPVILVVNGNLDLKGSLTIYGFIFVIGKTTTEVLGNVTINGGMVTTDNLNMTGSSQINYNSTILSNIQNQSSMNFYAKVTGSWKDY